MECSSKLRSVFTEPNMLWSDATASDLLALSLIENSVVLCPPSKQLCPFQTPAMIRSERQPVGDFPGFE